MDAADLPCSFCGTPQRKVRKLIAGPEGVFICDACVASGLARIAEVPAAGSRKRLAEVPSALKCSFCGEPPKKRFAYAVRRPYAVCVKCLEIALGILVESWELRGDDTLVVPIG